MKRAARLSRVGPACLLLAITAATMTACSGSPPTAEITGTVYVSGQVTRTALARHALVVAWRGTRQVARAPLVRTGSWVAFTPGSASAVGRYRLAVAPGRYSVQVVGDAPAGDARSRIATVRAGATVTRDLSVVFHPGPSPAPGATAPLHPYGLAVGPSGRLYEVDVGRDQVLEYDPNGTFTVLAGDGHQGYSGDGGPATRAELRLTPFSGLAVSRDGTVDISDSGNDRVRAVTPDGRITTVLGDGRGGGPPTPSAALAASVGRVEGLAIGPDDDLYVAAQKGVVQLTGGGTILWAAGSVAPGLLASCGALCNPAGESDFAGCDSLAFDGAGDLFCAGGAGTFAVYEVAAEPPGTVGQSLRYVGPFRGDGGPPALAGAPDGTVVMSYRGGVVRLRGDGSTTPVTTLDGVLGTHGGLPSIFVGGDGLAVGPDGSVYVDTNTGNTFTAVSAVVKIAASGAPPAILWAS